MPEEAILCRTAGVVATVVPRARRPRKSAPDTAPATDGLTLDSLAKINLIIALEEEFDIEIDETTIPASALRTVAALAQFVCAQLRPR